MRFLDIFALVALLPAAAFAFDDELCANPEVVRAARQPVQCQVSLIAYRAAGRSESATLAAVVTDNMTRAYFLRPDGGEVIALGAMRSLARDPFPDRIVRGLGLDIPSAGPASRMYERAIEKGPEGYCVVYRMKPPYAGELRNCDGFGNPGGAVGFAPGITTARAAYKAVCDIVTAGAGKACGPEGVQVTLSEVRYEPDGRMYYRLDTVERLGRVLIRKSQYEVRTYHVDAASGTVSLQRQSAEECSGNDCTPLPGGIVR